MVLISEMGGSEFEDSQGYAESPCFKEKSREAAGDVDLMACLPILHKALVSLFLHKMHIAANVSN